jgi:hypothetical protein
MSTINTSVLLGHADSQVNLSAAATETVDGKEFTILSLEVDTTDYEIAPDIISAQRAVCVKVQSGDDVLIGIDGVDYPFRVQAGGGQLFRFNVEGYELAEETLPSIHIKSVGSSQVTLAVVPK